MREHQGNRASRLKEREEEEERAREQDNERRKRFEERLARRREAEMGDDEERPRPVSARNRMSDSFDEDDEEPKKAPWPLRLLAWAALVCVFFAAGYGGTSLVFKWMDSKGITAGTGDVSVQSGDIADEGAKVKYVVSVPDGAGFKAVDCEMLSGGLREDELRAVVDRYMDELKSAGIFKKQVPVKNLFRSGEWLYLDLGGQFTQDISAMDAKAASSVITGLIKTVAENFSPLNRVKIYIDGSETKEKLPIDLSRPWQMPKGNKSHTGGNTRLG